MIFEGPEKKFEIVFKNKDACSVFDDLFWGRVVKKANALILSSVKNNSCKAYLLSESSLFVWPDRVTMITCGTTTLVNSISYLVDAIGEENIASLIFQRKNEYFSHLQKSNFFDDAKLLDQIFGKGKTLRFGRPHNHHYYLYHLDRNYDSTECDQTTELLMYDISGQAKEVLNIENQTKETIREFIQAEKIFKGFSIDDHAFGPLGYSLNAIKGDDYITIHITPEEENSYVSFETSIAINESSIMMLKEMINIFSPKSFDFLTFNNDFIDRLNLVGYKATSKVEDKLDTCGYDVKFYHYINNETNIENATKIETEL